ncbi:MAG TPA: sigma-54 dependent transcriptional regulator [Candidatus Hydrogenedentes bacterium]|nr:sigma-54 dependent transcriptional regulator [Candidatus Hydrogenedentota bacterium]
MRILIIDNDVDLCRSMQAQLRAEGHRVDFVHTGADGMLRLASDSPDILFLDLYLPDTTGLRLLKQIQDMKCDTIIIMITGVQDAKATIESIQSGAFDYIRKPFDLDTVLLVIEKAARHIKNRRAVTGKEGIPISPLENPYEIVGSDERIIDVLKTIARLSENRVAVLITGESGTGKELVARTLHNASSPLQPFVAVNCSAVVPTLLESELFGHEKGAYTGADSARMGKLELAGEGILFLDEIGDMAQDLQAKLLRVLQEREYERVGGSKLLSFKGRVVASTNRNLLEMVSAGTFREDLYFRLAVSTIHLPALRERLEDIPALTNHILAHLNRELHKDLREIEPGALQRLKGYDWPGNVRELVNVLTRAALLTRGHLLTEHDLLDALEPPYSRPGNDDSFKTLREMEKDHIARSLQASGWNITRTAEQLGVTRVTLRKKIDDYHLTRARFMPVGRRNPIERAAYRGMEII